MARQCGELAVESAEARGPHAPGGGELNDLDLELVAGGKGAGEVEGGDGGGGYYRRYASGPGWRRRLQE